jgi:hypothetical protein
MLFNFLVINRQIYFLYSLFLSLYFLFLCGSLGRTILMCKFFREVAHPRFFSLPIGMGFLSLAIFLLGIWGLLQLYILITLMVVIQAVSITETRKLLLQVTNLPRSIADYWKAQSVFGKISIVMALMIWGGTIIQCFTPPYDYDGLAYHLQGPAMYLANGKISPIPQNWFTFFPSFYEMIYMLGIALGTDIFARLIHYFTYLVLLWTIHKFTKYFLGSKISTLTLLILLGIPILPFWASISYTDIAWVWTQFLAVIAILIWSIERRNIYIVLAGIMQGLSIGCKYLALISLVINCIILFVLIWQRMQFGYKLKNGIFQLSVFYLTSFLFSAHWFIRNLLWTGDPVFPFLRISSIVPLIRLDFWNDYLHSFGYSKNIWELLLIPLRLFSQREQFGTYMGLIDFPSPIFLISFIYLFIRPHVPGRNKEVADIMGGFSVLYYLFWLFGSRQTRFLLPIYPFLAILSAICIYSICSFRLSLEKYIIAFVGSFVLVSLIISVNVLAVLNPFDYLVGEQTKEEFLQKMVKNFEATEFITDHLLQTDRVQFLWDGRAYYCDERCVADIDQMYWPALYYSQETEENIAIELRTEKITHLYINKIDADTFLRGHDQDHKIQESYDFLQENFLPDCADKIWEDEVGSVYKLIDGHCEVPK